VVRFDPIVAEQLLVETEKAAGLKPQHGEIDREYRLAYALYLQDVACATRVFRERVAA
jgi:hypothetical protein